MRMNKRSECPHCGEDGFRTYETCEYEEGYANRSYECSRCDAYVRAEHYRPLTPDDKRECANCNAAYMPNEKGERFCGHCGETKISYNIYGHTFGLIVPGETGVIYRHQTSGVMCRHVELEGSFIPLKRPLQIAVGDDDIDKKYRFENDYDYADDGDMLYALKRANYNGNEERANEIWSDIRDKLGFEFERVDAPDGQPRNQEALMWIEITETDDGYCTLNDAVVGKTVALTYPNCD